MGDILPLIRAKNTTFCFRCMFSLPRYVQLVATVLSILGSGEHTLRADDPSDQSKSAARAWQQSQVGKFGPFLNDPYLVVPLDIPSATLTHQKTNVEESLKSFVLDTTPGTHVQILNDGRYVLYGDLFKAKELYALVELPVEHENDPGWDGGRLAFAQRVNGEWQLRGLWNITTRWRAKDAPKDEDEHVPVVPAEAPFELVDFDGDGIPEVIMAGEIWKYYQVFHLLRFDPKTRSLQLLASAMDKPELCDGYVRLYYNSGHRSIFEEWMYAKLIHGKLKEIASWHNGTPYNEGDDEGLRASALNPQGRLEEFRIDDAATSTSEHCFRIKGTGVRRATVCFPPKKVTFPEGQALIDLETPWLFHHLTGLPADLLARQGKAKPLPSFAKYESVKISGNANFVRRLRLVHD